LSRQKKEYGMDSEILQRARTYESQMDQKIREEERPGFHLTPRVGWMNDPNGFCYYGGRYHLFYQYHPYSTHWGPMHWGHAVSRDLLHWSYLPAALAPDADCDREGCFSGCALTLPDGRQELIYTGVSRGGIQAQCVAAGDGRDYEKAADNPILSERDLPPEVSPADFRDPKAWQEADGTYRLLCAAKSRDGGDTMFLLYESRDALHWHFVRTFLRNSELREPIGRMFECPDFFLLDGQYVLLASSQDMEGSARYHSGNGSFCLLGDYDAAAGAFVPRADQSVDAGIDFYAEQTILSPDGRRIMIGWMQNWDTSGIQPEGCRWFGQMSIPRELSLRNGQLCQWPIRELEELRRDPVAYRNAALGREPVELPGIRGRRLDLEVDIAGAQGTVTLSLAADEKHHTDLIYRPQESLLTLDRSASGTRRAGADVCSTEVTGREGHLRLRIVLDRFSVEVFVNGGEKALSMTLFSKESADRIRFMANAPAELAVTAWQLR
jgi:sucrose-6-phosphate hydrolase SacC (GH32 family)